MSETEVIFTICLLAIYTLFALVFSTKLMKSNESALAKFVYLFIIFIPILGPLLYYWIRNWPSRLPQHLDGRNAGIGGRYISESASLKARNPSFYKKLDADIREGNEIKRRKRIKKAKRKEKIDRFVNKKTN